MSDIVGYFGHKDGPVIARSGYGSGCLSSIGYFFHGNILVSIGICFELVDIKHEHIPLNLKLGQQFAEACTSG